MSLSENEYLMKTILRICVVCKGRVAPFAADIIRQLTEVLARVRFWPASSSLRIALHVNEPVQTCKNPTNPMFAHHMFECVAALMKFICESSPSQSLPSRACSWRPFRRSLHVTSLISCLTSFSSLRSSLTCDLRLAQVRCRRCYFYATYPISRT